MNNNLNNNDNNKYSFICNDLANFNMMCSNIKNNPHFDPHSKLVFDKSLCNLYSTLYTNCKQFRTSKLNDNIFKNKKNNN